MVGGSISDVTVKTDDLFDTSLNKTKTIDVTRYAIRIDRGIKIYLIGIPSCIATIFNLDSPPAFVTDFGKGRVYITVNFIIDEGSPAANETEFMDWSAFVRINTYKADHTWLKIGSNLSGNTFLTDNSEGIEGKVVRFICRREEGEEDYYCTLQFVHCIELEII